MTRKWLIGVILIVIGIGSYLTPKLEFETDLSGLRLADDAAVKDYEALNKLFPKQSENPIVILVHKEAWETYADFTLLDSISNCLNHFKEVNEVSCISNLRIPKNGAFGPRFDTYLSLESPEKFQKWKNSKNRYPDVEDKYLSKNKKYSLFYLDCPTGVTKSVIDSISILSKKLPTCELIVLQKDLAEEEMRTELATESIVLASICIALILIAFYLFTKSLKGLLLIGFIILFNMSATVIFMYFTTIAFNIQMIALPCLIIIFSFTDLMHILYHQTEITINKHTNKSLKKELKAVLGRPIFLTSLSNLFGFVIFLGLSQNKDLTDLALVAIVAIVIAYLSSRHVVIHLIRANESYINIKKIRVVQSFCIALVRRLTGKRKLFLSALTFILIGLFGLLWITFKIDTTATDFLTNDSNLRKGQTILSDHFYGSNTLEISINYADSNGVWNLSNLEKIEQIETILEEQFTPLYLVSPTTIVKRNHRFRINGQQKAYELPTQISENTLQGLNKHYVEWGGDQVIATNKKAGKIIMGYQQSGLHASLAHYLELDELFKKLSNASIQFNLTGPAYLINKGTYEFTRNLITGWSFGVLLSVLLIGFIQRSLMKGLILLMVNLIPILFVVVLMPFFGLEINPQSLFLLTILAGLCVDDSIYIMLQSKNSEIGYFPVLTTSFVLMAGFIAFGFSDITSISPFALIFFIGIMTALLLDLLVLPLFTQMKNE